MCKHIYTEARGRIVTNVCTDVGVHDVITCADLNDYRLRGLGVAVGQILHFSIDLRSRPYNTLALPCECGDFIKFYHRSMACLGGAIGSVAVRAAWLR